jgi:hypothetical protein
MKRSKYLGVIICENHHFAKDKRSPCYPIQRPALSLGRGWG